MAEVDPRVLTWVNRERMFLHLGEPLDALPKGLPRACDCPIALALSAEVGSSAYFYELPSGACLSAALPDYVKAFVTAFDEGAYPELVEA